MENNRSTFYSRNGVIQKQDPNLKFRLASTSERNCPGNHNYPNGATKWVTTKPMNTRNNRFQTGQYRTCAKHSGKVFRYIPDLPEGSKYFPFHPVFKFVDSFLTDSNINNGNAPPPRCWSTGETRKKPPGRVLNNRGNCSVKNNCGRYFGGDASSKIIPKKLCTTVIMNSPKQDQDNTDVNNIDNIVRISLMNHCPKDCPPPPVPSKTLQFESQLLPEKSEQYINQLKAEIAQSKTQMCNLKTPVNDEYVEKLKQEVTVRRNKCLEDARNIINELQNEILNYRLQAKVKYSSSCSNVDNVVSSNVYLSHQISKESNPVEPKKIGESPDPLRDEVIRNKPCETLWQSKYSLPSSTDVTVTSVVPVTQTINFEKKLVEANSLIEKVRDTLRDMGKGMCCQIPEGKSSNVLNLSCSSQACKAKMIGDENKVIPKKNECQKPKSQEDIQRYCRNKCIEKGQCKKDEKPIEIKKQAKVTITNKIDKPKEKPKEVIELMCAIRQKKDPDDAVILFERQKQEDKVSESMEMLQKKLKVITESSENESSTSKNEKPETPSVVRVERACSPIAVPQVTEIMSSTNNTTLEQDVPRDGSSHSGEITPTKISSKTQENSFEPCDLPDIDEAESSKPSDEQLAVEPTKSDRSHNHKKMLSVQLMPSVNIRGGLVMQKALHLCIKPTGSITNSVSPGDKNIGYEEVCIDKGEPLSKKCPEDCRNTTGDICKASSEVNVSQTGHDLKERKGVYTPISRADLNESAFLLYQSYQILDESYKTCSKRSSLGALIPGAHKNLHTLDSHSGTSSQPGVSSSSHATSAHVNSPFLVKPSRTPWDFGFYKTVSTQCSNSFIGAEKEEDDLRKFLESSIQPLSPSSADEATPKTASEQSLEEEEPVKDTTSSSEAPSISEKVNKKPEIVEEKVDEPQLKSEGESGDDKLPEDVELDKSLSSETVSADTTVASESGDEDGTPLPQPVPKKSASIVSDGSSETSFTIRGSIISNKESLVGPNKRKAGVKRPHQSESEEKVSSVKNVQPAAKPDQTTNLKPDKTEPVKPRKVSADKDRKRSQEREKKIDENIQVALGSTSGSETDTSLKPSEAESHSTIAFFIKGLTGTSEEHINKLRSTPSFPKADLTNWSKTVLRTIRGKHDSVGTDEKKGSYGEEEIDSVDYTAKLRHESQDTSSILSEKSKQQRLQYFQNVMQHQSKHDPDKTVMTVTQLKGDAGEGSDAFRNFPKTHLSSQCHAFGGIVGASNKTVMPKSHSDPSPADESISEGEIKHKSSHSIGEVVPHKFRNDRKILKSSTKRSKKHSEDSSEAALRTARQRMQYNNWVTYYLQKHQKKVAFVDDSSSFSASSKM